MTVSLLFFTRPCVFPRCCWGPGGEVWIYRTCQLRWVSTWLWRTRSTRLLHAGFNQPGDTVLPDSGKRFRTDWMSYSPPVPGDSTVSALQSKGGSHEPGSLHVGFCQASLHKLLWALGGTPALPSLVCAHTVCKGRAAALAGRFVPLLVTLQPAKMVLTIKRMEFSSLPFQSTKLPVIANGLQKYTYLKNPTTLKHIKTFGLLWLNISCLYFQFLLHSLAGRKHFLRDKEAFSRNTRLQTRPNSTRHGQAVAQYRVWGTAAPWCWWWSLRQQPAPCKGSSS